MSHRSYLNMSQPRKIIGQLVPDLFLSPSAGYTSLKYKDILAVRMDRIEGDFLPFDETDRKSVV